jgi:hypothetical protein
MKRRMRSKAYRLKGILNPGRFGFQSLLVGER